MHARHAESPTGSTVHGACAYARTLTPILIYTLALAAGDTRKGVGWEIQGHIARA